MYTWTRTFNIRRSLYKNISKLFILTGETDLFYKVETFLVKNLTQDKHWDHNFTKEINRNFLNLIFEEAFHEFISVEFPKPFQWKILQLGEYTSKYKKSTIFLKLDSRFWDEFITN